MSCRDLKIPDDPGEMKVGEVSDIEEPIKLRQVSAMLASEVADIIRKRKDETEIVYLALDDMSYFLRVKAIAEPNEGQEDWINRLFFLVEGYGYYGSVKPHTFQKTESYDVDTVVLVVVGRDAQELWAMERAHALANGV